MQLSRSEARAAMSIGPDRVTYAPRLLLTEDTLLTRIDALIDGRDYTELELPSTAWRRWAYYAAKGEWQ